MTPRAETSLKGLSCSLLLQLTKSLFEMYFALSHGPDLIVNEGLVDHNQLGLLVSQCCMDFIGQGQSLLLNIGVPW